MNFIGNGVTKRCCQPWQGMLPLMNDRNNDIYIYIFFQRKKKIMKKIKCKKIKRKESEEIEFGFAHEWKRNIKFKK